MRSWKGLRGPLGRFGVYNERMGIYIGEFWGNSVRLWAGLRPLIF